MKENSFLYKPNVTYSDRELIIKTAVQKKIMKRMKKRSRQQEGEVWVPW